MSLCCYLLSRENRGHAKYCSLFSVGTLPRLGRKLLIGAFNGLLLMSFILDWESEIINQLVLHTNLSGNQYYCVKIITIIIIIIKK